MTVIRHLSPGVRDDEPAGAFCAAALGYLRRPPRQGLGTARVDRRTRDR